MNYAMNKFEELKILALQKRKQFRELRDECNHFATQLVNGLREYLGSPINAVYCVKVDKEHRIVEQPTESPDLCYCFDTFWYFLLRFDFQIKENVSAKIGLLVGTKKTENGFTVKLPVGDYQIDSPDDQTEFYEQLYNALKEDLSRPWTQAPKTFGFTMSN